ncbi:hypothetical protein BE221DRAFT_81669, partial [Ostreococcus tauri]
SYYDSPQNEVVGIYARISSRITTVIRVVNTTKETIADLMSHSQFHNKHMTTGRINQVSILSTRQRRIYQTVETDQYNRRDAPQLASRPKVIESLIRKSDVSRTHTRLPPHVRTRLKRPHVGPTEGPPDDNQRTRNIPYRSSQSHGVSRRLHRHASHSPPSSGSCNKKVIRLASGYRYKLLFRASIVKHEECRRLVCRAAVCISTDRGCASAPPTHSSAARLAAPGRPATHPARGYDDRRAFRWVGGANLRSHFLTDVQGRTTCRYVYLAYAVSYACVY